MKVENGTRPTRASNASFASEGVKSSLRDTSRQADDAVVPARPKAMVVLHWLTVLCVGMAATLILVRDQVYGRSLEEWLLEGHRHFGLLVLILFVVRLILRLRLGKLPHTSHASRMVRLLAGLTHIALYTLLLSLPLLGWALSDAEGRPVHFFGATLPAIVAENEDLADTLTTWHVDAAWLLLGLVSLHIVAALWHHFVLRDGVLKAMLPQRRRC